MNLHVAASLEDRIGDVVRMVESLVESCAQWRFTPLEYVVAETPSQREYVMAKIPLNGRDVALMRRSGNSCDYLSDFLEHDEMRRNRRERRRLIRRQKLLDAAQFCDRACISRRELHRRVRRGTIVKVVIANKAYYPAFFARKDRLAFRLSRVSSAMGAGGNPWTAQFELTYCFESLGNKTMMQAMRRGAGFRAALRYARGLGDC